MTIVVKKTISTSRKIPLRGAGIFCVYNSFIVERQNLLLNIAVEYEELSNHSFSLRHIAKNRYPKTTNPIAKKP
jgi:hypothetical protein